MDSFNNIDFDHSDETDGSDNDHYVTNDDGGDTDHEFEGSTSSSDDGSWISEFDPETLPTKIQTPRPSLTELQGILRNINLEEEFMLQDFKMDEEPQEDIDDNIIMRQSKTRASLSNEDNPTSSTSKGDDNGNNDNDKDDDIKSEEDEDGINMKDPSDGFGRMKSPPPTRAIPDLPNKTKHRQSKELIQYENDKNDNNDNNNNNKKEIKQTETLKEKKSGKKWYINQYLCYKFLGKGAFGKVCLATDITTNTKYALKVLNKSLLRRKRILRKNKPPTNMLENIFREIAIMKKLDHPNVLHIHEVIDDPANDKLFMVIDYMDNGSVLGEKGAEAKCDPMNDHELIRQYIREMILGLDYLHSNDIIHGDIKPENLLLTKNDHLKIADFGVSFMLDDETCPNKDGRISRSQGTPAFTAPETGSKSFKAYPIDIWAMGVTLYMMITGICPFAGNGIYDTYEKIQNENPPIPNDIDENMKDFLENILLKDPDKRITLKQAFTHPWITKNGTEPLNHPMEYNNHKFEKRVSITKEDIEFGLSIKSDTMQHLRSLNDEKEEKDKEEKDKEEKDKEDKEDESYNPFADSYNGSESSMSDTQPPKQRNNIKKKSKKPKKKIPNKQAPTTQQQQKESSSSLKKKEKNEYNPFSDTNNQNNIIVNMNQVSETTYSSKPIKIDLTNQYSDPIQSNNKKKQKKSNHSKKKSLTPNPSKKSKQIKSKKLKSKKKTRKPSREAPIAPKSKKTANKTPEKPTKTAPINTKTKTRHSAISTNTNSKKRSNSKITMNKQQNGSRKSTPNIASKKKKLTNTKKGSLPPKPKKRAPSIITKEKSKQRKRTNSNLKSNKNKDKKSKKKISADLNEVEEEKNISPTFVKRRRSSEKNGNKKSKSSKSSKSPKKKGKGSKIAPKNKPLPKNGNEAPKNKPLPKTKKTKTTKNPTN